MRLRHVGAVAHFSAATNARMTITRAGYAAGLCILFLGPGLSLSTGRGWTYDGELGFYGFLVAALFVLRSGLEEQRESGLMDFLRHNLVSPYEHAVGIVLGLLGTWLALCAGFSVAVLLATGGNLGTAAWHVGVSALRTLLLLGFLPLVEWMASLRLPFVLPAVLYAALLVGLSLAIGEEEALRLFVSVERGDVAALGRLAVQAVAWFVASTGAFLLATAAGGPGRDFRRGREVVPSGHGGAPVQG